MAIPTKVIGDRLLLSPRDALVVGGAAEEFESVVQAIFKTGYRHLVTDLSAVSRIDSAGIRALVRGLTTAQRLGGAFNLVAPSPAVLDVLRVARLDSVFAVYDRLDEAVARRWPWRSIVIFTGGIVQIVVLAILGSWLVPAAQDAERQWPAAGGVLANPMIRLWWYPFLEFGKLVMAAAIGVIVTAVHRRYRVGRPQTPSMEQAQVLLCVSGALMMIIIGGSLARAFGIAGAASIIRFRTPVEDAKDITILFLLMGLGMSAGVGAFGVAGLGTVFLCLTLVILSGIGTRRPREMMVEVEADRREFPTLHVQGVFARNHVIFEPREVSQGKALSVRYHTLLDAEQSIESLSEQLMAEGNAGVKSVAWELPRKSE